MDEVLNEEILARGPTGTAPALTSNGIVAGDVNDGRRQDRPEPVRHR